MLEKIARAKREEIRILKMTYDTSSVKPKEVPVEPGRALKTSQGRVQVIAEVKKASPLKGLFISELDVAGMARVYKDNGAAAISVITDQPFFQGSKEYLREVKQTVDVPVLRKDFILDEIQLYESLDINADFVLLIAAMLNYQELLKLSEKAQELKLCPLLEVHGKEDLEAALDLPVQLIGINNRRLKTFEVDLAASLKLADLIPDRFIKISESGIKTPDDMKLLEKAGFQGAWWESPWLPLLIRVKNFGNWFAITEMNEMTRVKFCGIKTLEEARCAERLQAWAIGEVFAPSSRRLEPDNAARINRQLKGTVKKVGVFVNEKFAALCDIIAACQLDMVQLHGEESPEYLAELPVPAIKSISMRSPFDLEEAKRWRPWLISLMLIIPVCGAAAVRCLIGPGWSLCEIRPVLL